MKLHCFFCGKMLAAADNSETFLCRDCQAVFSAKRDQGGCVIQMDVQGCGTPECCRHRGKAPA